MTKNATIKKHKGKSINEFNLHYERLSTEKHLGLRTKGALAILKANKLALRGGRAGFVGIRDLLSRAVQQVSRAGQLRFNKRLQAVEHSLDQPFLHSTPGFEEYLRYVVRDELSKVKGRGRK